MSSETYNYSDVRSSLFTDEGQRLFLKVRDGVDRKLTVSGAVRMEEAIRGVSGDSFEIMACLDRMVELSELVELTQQGKVRGQSRVFVAHPRRS